MQRLNKHVASRKIPVQNPLSVNARHGLHSMRIRMSVACQTMDAVSVASACCVHACIHLCIHVLFMVRKSACAMRRDTWCFICIYKSLYNEDFRIFDARVLQKFYYSAHSLKHTKNHCRAPIRKAMTLTWHICCAIQHCTGTVRRPSHISSCTSSPPSGKNSSIKNIRPSWKIVK